MPKYDYDSDIVKYQRAFSDFVEKLKTEAFTEKRYELKAQCIRDILSDTLMPLDQKLSEMTGSCPKTFELEWKRVIESLITAQTNLKRSVDVISRFFAWCYIERMWREGVSGNDAEAVLAKIQLGLDRDLDVKDIGQAVLSIIKMPSELLIEKFGVEIVGGLEKLKVIEKNTDDKINAWEENLKKSEERANGAEAKISKYEESLKKYKVAFGFLGLSGAFKEFFKRKQRERRFLLFLVFLFACIILYMPFEAYKRVNDAINNADLTQKGVVVVKSELETDVIQKPNEEVIGAKVKLETEVVPKTKEELKAKPDRTGIVVALESNASQKVYPKDDILSKSVERMSYFIPFVAIEILLIYFFRIILLHFNSSQAQILQLESKMAACGFIEDYVKFRKDNNDPDLGKFEALVFGGVVANLDNVPSTFDGLDQIIKAIKS